MIVKSIALTEFLLSLLLVLAVLSSSAVILWQASMRRRCPRNAGKQPRLIVQHVTVGSSDDVGPIGSQRPDRGFTFVAGKKRNLG
jgi:hypothetical protein